MSFLRQLTRGLRTLARRKAADRDIVDELSHYLEESEADFTAKGLSATEARRTARAQMGSRVAAHEQIRSYGWENAIDAFFADLRYSVRRLRGNPGFAAVSVLTLALGIGAGAAIFTVIDGVLLKPLPYPHSEQLVALRHTAPGLKIDDMNLAASLYFTYSEHNRVFQGVGMWSDDSWTVTGRGQPEQAPGLSATHAFLSTLGIQPQFGRGFSPTDDDPKSERVVLLSDAYWRAHFGADRSVLGRRILMDGNAHTAIGVLPPTFEFLDKKISLLAPLRMNRANIRLVSFCCEGFARLKPGVTLTEANADVARMLTIAPTLFAMNPGFAANAFTDARMAPRLRPLKDALVGDIGNTLWVLMGTVGIVLFIACANVANLLLVRADGRRQELAVRAALGAGWARLARELLMESTLLGLAGGAAGLALAWAAVRVLVASDLTHLPRIHDISIDPAVVLFTVSVSLLSGLLFGLIPVFRYTRPALATGLRAGGRSLTQSRERHRARGILVVVQVALALVLLIGSGLMVRTFIALRHVDPGFSGAAEVETLQIGIPDTQVADDVAVTRMQESILHRIEAIPGVTSVAAASGLPMQDGGNDPVYAQDQPPAPGSIPGIRRFRFVSPGFFSTAGTRLVAGRDVTWAETYSQTPVALVSENLARELWGSPRAALGKHIRPMTKGDWREVIGVVQDMRDYGIDQKPPTMAWWPILLRNFENDGTASTRSISYLVRSKRAGSATLREEIRQAVASVSPNLPIDDVKTLESVYEKSLARTSFTLALLAIAGAMALILGVVGIYGVVSYSISQRTREIGIRLALGSPLAGVTSLFVRNGLMLSGVGAACGIVAALALTRLMKSLLFEVNPADPATYIFASAGLILAAFLGSYLPARRATRVDPVEALRAES